MSEKTSRAYIPTEIRIKRIDEIPLIYGTRTSGAKANYKTKEDFPKLAGLIEGGFAKDIFLKIDEKRQRIIIPDGRDGSSLNDFNGRSDLENELSGIIASGESGISESETAILNNSNEEKMIVWYNGNWVAVNKYPVGCENGEEVYIPTDLALNIITNAQYNLPSSRQERLNASEIVEKLPKQKFDSNKFESVLASQLASSLNSKDLLSYWMNDGILNLMINTHMRFGPYKLKRINEKIEISFSINVEDKTENIPNKYSIQGIGSGEYGNAILSSFNNWNMSSGNALEEVFGSSSISASANVGFHIFPESANVYTINSFSHKDQNRHRSNHGQYDNVDVLDGWRIDRVGKVTMYNHIENKNNYEERKNSNFTKNIEPTAMDKNQYIRDAMHEFGHLLGLGDAYEGAEDVVVGESDVMYGIVDVGVDISVVTMQMVFLAALQNKNQHYHSHSGTKEVSEVILKYRGR